MKVAVFGLGRMGVRRAELLAEHALDELIVANRAGERGREVARKLGATWLAVDDAYWEAATSDPSVGTEALVVGQMRNRRNAEGLLQVAQAMADHPPSPRLRVVSASPPHPMLIILKW